MVPWNHYNPFGEKEAYGHASIITYRVLTIITWILSTVVSVYYSVNGALFDLNGLHKTAFAFNPIVIYIYWIELFVLQLGYITCLFSNKTERVYTAASIGNYFIVNNLLHSTFILLFAQSYFYCSEAILTVNFAQLTMLYFRHNTYSLFIHVPVISAPLAWTFVAIYWNGAIMISSPENLVIRVLGNICIWAILTYGGLFITIYKDYTMTFCLSILAASIGIAQLHKGFTLQCIFAFAILAILVVATLVMVILTVTSTSNSPFEADDNQFSCDKDCGVEQPTPALTISPSTSRRGDLQRKKVQWVSSAIRTAPSRMLGRQTKRNIDGQIA